MKSIKNGNALGRLVAGWVAATFLAAPLAHAGTGDFATPLAATPPPVEDAWHFGFEIYAWTPMIQGTTITGSDFEIDFDQILDSLNMTMMMSFGASKGRWFFGSDVIYLDMSTDVYGKTGPIKTFSDAGMKSWVINPVAGYTALQGDWGRFDVFGGARYLYIKGTLGLWVRLPRNSVYRFGSSHGQAWAGIVGVRGQFNLSEHWYIPYYADLGSGDPDFTWQVFAGIAYKFKSFDLVLGYRYLDWNMDSSGVLSDLDISGPVFGAKFVF